MKVNPLLFLNVAFLIQLGLFSETALGVGNDHHKIGLLALVSCIYLYAFAISHTPLNHTASQRRLHEDLDVF